MTSDLKTQKAPFLWLPDPHGNVSE